MKDVFRQMPDSVFPTLSTNNRLDMIDFIDSKMKAEVTNLLGGKSELTALTDDSLCLRMSNAATINMLLLESEEMIDSCHQIICMVQVFGTDSIGLDSKTEFYSPLWRRLTITPALSERDKKRVESIEKKTFLNFIDSILKKD